MSGSGLDGVRSITSDNGSAVLDNTLYGITLLFLKRYVSKLISYTNSSIYNFYQLVG